MYLSILHRWVHRCKKALPISSLLLVFHAAATGQGEANIWHFGYGQSIDFSSGTPQLGPLSNMATSEGCASICDAQGNLLFYTNGGGRIPALSGQDGGTIWDRSGNVLYDMAGTQGGGFSAAQSSVIIPKPGQPSGQYWLFTMEEIEFYVGGSVATQPLGRGLSLFEIDMTLNAGLGGVVAYTESIYSPAYEGLCAVRHANEEDYWIVINTASGDTTLCYLVTAQGVGTPVVTVHDSLVYGAIEVSPNGQYLVMSGGEGLALFDFDPATGLLSNPRLSGPEVEGYSEFSPNSKRLFLIDNNRVYCYDLTVSDPWGARQLVGNLPLSAGGQGRRSRTRMQLGPDGNIYFVIHYNGEQNYLSAIRCPNTVPTIVPNLLRLRDGDSFFSLPNFPDHLFASEEVELPVNLPDTAYLCAGDTLTLAAQGASSWSYTWSSGQSTSEIEVSRPGTYALVANDGCLFGSDTVVVELVEVLSDIGIDRAVCQGDTITLSARVVDGAMVSWSSNAGLIVEPTSATTAASFATSGQVALRVASRGCEAIDSLFVSVLPNPMASASAGSSRITLGEQVELMATGGATYTWLPNETLSCADCPNPLATPLAVGRQVYTLIAFSPDGCQDTTQVVFDVREPNCAFWLPNAFSPNFDGINDYFEPFGEITAFELSVYSRWGQSVYSGSLPWDGSFKGLAADMGVYVYVATIRICGKTEVHAGEVTLLR